MVWLRFWHFVKLTRPVFLLGGIMLYALGAVLAIVEGAAFNPLRLALGQALVTVIQLMTHYANEYYDLQSDQINTERTWFSGGSGVLSSGLFAPEVSRWAALICACSAVVLLLLTGAYVPAVLFLGAASLLAAWYYSAPPLSLSGSGWGELSASLVVVLLVPMVGYVMQSGGQVSLTLAVICLPLILIHFAMLLAFQIPDRHADQRVGKRTLAVRLGLEQVARLHNILLFIACVIVAGLTVLHWPGARWVGLAAPLAFWQMYWFTRLGASPDHKPIRYAWLTMGAIGLFALSSGLWLLGIVLAEMV